VGSRVHGRGCRVHDSGVSLRDIDTLVPPHARCGVRVRGSGFGVWGLGFGGWGLEFGDLGLVIRVWGRILDGGFRV